jgi:cell division protein ZapA
MNKSRTICVKLLGKDFQINCPEGKEQELLDAAYHLDQKMIEIRNHGRIFGLERIAIMAALNATHDLLHQNQANKESARELNEKVTDLQNKIDSVLLIKDGSSLVAEEIL